MLTQIELLHIIAAPVFLVHHNLEVNLEILAEALLDHAL